MRRTWLAPWILLAVAHSVLAEGPPDAGCLAFTQEPGTSDAIDADKDARVWSDQKLGKGWRAATALDVAVHFDPSRHDPSVRFCLAASPFVWRLTLLQEVGEPVYALGPEPPPPPGGVWPQAVIAAIRLDAPIAFTRGKVQVDATETEKTALIRSELGERYRGASMVRIQEAFRRVLPPGTEGFSLVTGTEAWRARLVDGRVSVERSETSAEERPAGGLRAAAGRD